MPATHLLSTEQGQAAHFQALYMSDGLSESKESVAARDGDAISIYIGKQPASVAFSGDRLDIGLWVRRNICLPATEQCCIQGQSFDDGASVAKRSV